MLEGKQVGEMLLETERISRGATAGRFVSRVLRGARRRALLRQEPWQDRSGALAPERGFHEFARRAHIRQALRIAERAPDNAGWFRFRYRGRIATSLPRSRRS